MRLALAGTAVIPVPLCALAGQCHDLPVSLLAGVRPRCGCRLQRCGPAPGDAFPQRPVSRAGARGMHPCFVCGHTRLQASHGQSSQSRPANPCHAQGRSRAHRRHEAHLSVRVRGPAPYGQVLWRRRLHHGELVAMESLLQNVRWRGAGATTRCAGWPRVCWSALSGAVSNSSLQPPRMRYGTDGFPTFLTQHAKPLPSCARSAARGYRQQASQPPCASPAVQQVCALR